MRRPCVSLGPRVLLPRPLAQRLHPRSCVRSREPLMITRPSTRLATIREEEGRSPVGTQHAASHGYVLARIISLQVQSEKASISVYVTS